jgi:hypothetical protein
MLLSFFQPGSLRVQSKAHVAILPPLTLSEESSVYGERGIAVFAIPLLVF